MKPFCLLFCFLLHFACLGNDVDKELGEIQQALAENRVSDAHQLLETYTNSYIQAKDFLNLSYFIPYTGYVADKRGLNGISSVDELLDFIHTQSQDPRVLRQAHLEIHTYYVEAGKYQLAYEANERALEYTFLIQDHKPAEWAVIESNLGVISNYLGKPDQAKYHTFRAMEGYNQDPNPPKENIFNLYNDIGVRYWYEAKWDSAEYFWLKGIDHLNTMDSTPTNLFFRKAMINNNLAAVYDVKGNPQESIRRVKMSISLNQYFLENAKDDPRYNRAMTSLFYGSANLAAVLKSVGNYQQALQIHEYTLTEKQKRFNSGHPEIIETLIHVGQAHNSLKNYEQAKTRLIEALKYLEALEGEYFLQAADAHYTLGLVFESEKNFPEAKKHFLLSKQNYQDAFKGKYDYMYLDFLVNASQFFASIGEADLAYSFAKEGLNYISKIDGINSISGINQVLNMGLVAYNLGDYTDSKKYAEESENLFGVLLERASGNVDSIRIEFEKPRAILLKVKTNYQLEQDRPIGFLESNIQLLEQAISIMDKRKTTLSDAEDLAVWVLQGEEINDYLIKLKMELLEQTQNNGLITEILAIQESGIYNKIRSQLQQAKASEFGGVPSEILEEERRLRSGFAEIFEEAEAVSAYISLNEEWENLMQLLKSKYPIYYQTRFAGVSPEEIDLPEDLQAVRFFFVEEDLKAVVFAKGKPHLFNLEHKKSLIQTLMDNWDEPKVVGEISHLLYQQLWQPFEHLLEDERVLIIPDGELFNLSFEMLATAPISSFSEFSHKSLLARHHIYYNISLWLSSRQDKRKFSANYVAFTPGFVDSMKEKYLGLIKDSLYLDKAYLSLLPQPFTLTLAEKAAKLFGGKNYSMEASTPEVFRSQAGKNKIIHIGTHAESNNLSPAYSRLIFAKPAKPDPSIEENSIYAYEIYNTDMSAYLTVLTACETGKPVYQPGEGMISLSHAFQYSGSESLLTSLWKIDEKASMEITGFFLQNIKSGLPKDKALQLAKLEYLETAKGRTLSPQYWAGLVLIGDPGAIEGLGNKSSWVFWIAGLLILLVAFYGITNLRTRNS
jgi:CHAT domain-containing protein